MNLFIKKLLFSKLFTAITKYLFITIIEYILLFDENVEIFIIINIYYVIKNLFNNYQNSTIF